MWKARFWSYDLVKLVSQPQFIHHIFIDHVSHTVDPVKSKYVSAGSAISAGTTSPVQHFWSIRSGCALDQTVTWTW